MLVGPRRPAAGVWGVVAEVPSRLVHLLPYRLVQLVRLYAVDEPLCDHAAAPVEVLDHTPARTVPRDGLKIWRFKWREGRVP